MKFRSCRCPIRHRTPSARPSVARWLMLALSLGLIGPHDALGQQIQIQVGGPNNAPTSADDPYGVFLPTNRSLTRGIAQARERLNDKEYNEALAFLQQVLDRDEDAFLDESLDAKSHRGLKAAARALIAQLPPDGRQMYELLHTAPARRELEAALESGKRDDLTKLVRRYFLTQPGYEATLVLAQLDFDRGHPLSAANLYEQLRADPAASKLFEPQLSMLTAVSWIAAGQRQPAAAALRALSESHSSDEVELAGRKRRLPSAGASDDDLLAWLGELAELPLSPSATNSDWLSQRGNPTRNADYPGGAPHLRARWQSRVVNDPRFESFLTTRRQQSESQGVVTLPAARPIAAGDVVLMRTPQNVVAVDFRTGKRIWETRDEETGARDQVLAEINSEDGSGDSAPLAFPLEQRIWNDTLANALSSDGERAFALSGMPLAQREQPSGWGIGPAFGGGFELATSPTNRLTAYELATEGKLAWEIDGESMPGELSGCFFLGPPLAIDGTLYVLAEIRSAIYLLALEPATGKLAWRQQLVGLEQGITLDPQRRLNGATPSYSAGLLVCPTTAGMVVAIDVVRREFAWVYRYPRKLPSFLGNRQGWQGRFEDAVERTNNRWLDGSVVIADGKLLLTPPESGELHALDLTSGTLLWKKPRESSLFIGCVDRGKVLLVGTDSVRAVRLADGADAWPAERNDLPEGAITAGMGYLSAGRYYLPMSTGQVVSIDTQDGTITDDSKPGNDVSVGNLICHRGAIISQSTLMLDKFEQIDVLREHAQAALAANPRDAEALRDLAEMWRLDGKLTDSIKMLKQAYEIDPTDPLTRDTLADALLEQLAANFAEHRADVELLRTIAYRPQQQLELLRIEAAGLEAAGQRMDALGVYQRLAETTAMNPAVLSISPELSVRSDRWVRARINALWASATPGERETISQQLEEQQRGWETPAVSELQTFLASFDGLPGSDEVRLKLIRELMTRNDVLGAEIELLKLERSESAEAQAAAAVLLTKLLLSQGRIDDAQALAETIASRWPVAAVVEGRTVQQWLDTWQPELVSARSASNWPIGQWKADDLPTTRNDQQNRTRRSREEYQLGLRRLNLEQHPGTRFGLSQWFIARDNAGLVGRDGLGNDVFTWNGSRRSGLSGSSGMVEAAQLGDLLFVASGGQLVGVDAREVADNQNAEVLWQAAPAGRYLASSARRRRLSGSPIYHPSSQRKRVMTSPAVPWTALGPVTPHGVVFQDQQRLCCVDPVSGETLWSRTDVPAGCELFGDDQFVFAAHGSESTLYVIGSGDGQLISKRELPSMPWLLTTGRNIARLVASKVDGKARKTIVISDAAAGETRFEADYDPAVCVTTIEPDSIAVVEPSGKFQLLDVGTGSVAFEQMLSLAAPPKSLTALRSGDQLYLCVGEQSRPGSSQTIVQEDFPIVDGQVFAFDMRDGRPLWPGPAMVERRGLALGQPSEIPCLIFIDQVVSRDGDGGKKLRLLCLDKRTGATAYRNDDLPESNVNQIRIFASNDDAPKVNIEMSSRTVQLRLTDLPRSPEPPANDLVEAPRKSLGRGLLGVGRRIGSVIQGAIQDPNGANWPLPVPQTDGNGNNQAPMDDD